MQTPKKIKVAINGFGRIGRAFFKLAIENPRIEIVAVNDLADIENLAYLLKYDSPYPTWTSHVQVMDLNLDVRRPSEPSKNILQIAGKDIPFFSEPDPRYLPWKDLKVDIAVEATGIFNTYQKARAHLEAGARRVILTAPAKDETEADCCSVARNNNPPQPLQTPDYGVIGKTILMGINDEELKDCQISANGSCTTNAVSPVLQILNKTIGVEKALLNTIHSYTATQKIVDSADKKDFRRGRAGAQNIIPTTTGAASATTLAIKELAGRFDGLAVRVPTALGSLADLTFTAKRNTSEKEINKILKQASQEEKWRGIFTTTEKPVVSSDIIGNIYASIADLSLTKVVGGNLAKVLIWYDNEMGYANTLIKHINKIREIL